MESSSKPTILVVDEEPGVRKLLRLTIDPEKARIVEADDGAEAVALARAIHPDIVLLDVYLPTLSGYEVCTRLRADPQTAGTRLIVLSSVPDAKDRLTARRLGVDGYVPKPFHPSRLRRLVDDTLHLACS